jgi:phospholipid N-methyltransferase
VAARGLLPVDHIVSGLPFVSLPPLVTRQILEGVSAVLRPGGTFTTFQYLPGSGLPSAVSFRRSLTARIGSEPAVRLVMRNVPPALVLTWKKP